MHDQDIEALRYQFGDGAESIAEHMANLEAAGCGASVADVIAVARSRGMEPAGETAFRRLVKHLEIKR